MSSRILRVCVVGAAGYSGAEVVGLLLGHPGVELVGLFGSDRRAGGSDTERFDSLHPRHRGETTLRVEPASAEAILAKKPDAVFLATPHEVSYELAPALRSAGVVVLDLSAAFRLREPALYAAHYGGAHPHPELLDEAVYGLPELHEHSISKATLIACPGCYPTSVILPVAPLRHAGLLLPGAPVIVDSASGVSGAGRSPSLKSLYCEVSYQPYGVLNHRHGPEMSQECGAEVLFTPHLMALDRGIVSTIHPTLVPGTTAAKVRRVLESVYADQPFVRILPEGIWPSVSAVVNTNYCDIAIGGDPTGRHLVLISAIDNLMKGAAGQALQAFNIRFGLEQAVGLRASGAAHGAGHGANASRIPGALAKDGAPVTSKNSSSAVDAQGTTSARSGAPIAATERRS